MSDRCSDNDDESDIDRDGGGDSDLDGDKRDVGIRSSHTKEEWGGRRRTQTLRAFRRA